MACVLGLYRLLLAEEPLLKVGEALGEVGDLVRPPWYPRGP